MGLALRPLLWVSYKYETDIEWKLRYSVKCQRKPIKFQEFNIITAREIKYAMTPLRHMVISTAVSVYSSIPNVLPCVVQQMSSAKMNLWLIVTSRSLVLTQVRSMCSWTLPCISSLVPSILHLSHGFQCSPTFNRQPYEERHDSWPIQPDILSPPLLRLTSRKLLWLDLQPVDIKSRWRHNWKSAQVVNSHLVCDPTIRQPGFDLPR